MREFLFVLTQKEQNCYLGKAQLSGREIKALHPSRAVSRLPWELWTCPALHLHLKLYAPPPHRYGGISVGGVNSQHLLNTTEIEAAVRDLKALLGPLQVRTSRSRPPQTGAALQFAVFFVSLRFWWGSDELSGVCVSDLISLPFARAAVLAEEFRNPLTSEG